MSVTVAALMPTIKSHAAFRPTAEACFHNQKYPADWQVSLVIDDTEGDSLGKKAGGPHLRGKYNACVSLEC